MATEVLSNHASSMSEDVQSTNSDHDSNGKSDLCSTVTSEFNSSAVADCDLTGISPSMSPGEGSSDLNDSEENKCGFDEVPIITETMIAEEKKAAKEREKQALKEQRELDVQIAEKEKEQRYEKLINLLNKSKFYGKFIAERLQSSENSKPVEPKTAARKKGKKPLNQTIVESSEQNKSDPKSTAVCENTEEVPEAAKGDASRGRTSPRILSKKRKLDEDSAESFPEKRIKTEENSDETFVTSLGLTASIRQPDLFEGGALRDYQLDGLDWLKALFENGVNGILGDEMGLGKTAQCIAFICHLINMNIAGPFLIIGPLSTLPNWVMEFRRFAPKIPLILFHGDASARAAAKSKFRIKVRVNDKRVFPVIITSFEMPLMEAAFMKQFVWKFIIVDEGHRLKNHKSTLSRTLRQFNSVNRLLLTGTPLHNDLAELWALLNFLLPELFNDLNAFESWLDLSVFSGSEGSEILIEQERKTNVISTLHQILAPFMLRRRKVDVEILIPPKKELLVYASMTSLQKELYEATLNHSIAKLLGLREAENPVIPNMPDGSRTKRNLQKKDYNHPSLAWYMEQDSMVEEETVTTKNNDKDKSGFRNFVKMQNPMMQLRKIANHPYLVKMPMNPDTNIPDTLNEDLVNSCGKLLVLDAMLAKLKRKGHKVLIFSTFCLVLDLLEDYMELRKYTYERLDGSCKIEERMESIKSFNSDPNVFAFLISTRAGGLGINLTAADTVIIYDSDWNPQVDLQAQDRCHRIGQTKPVVIYRFVSRGTIDEKIVERASAKRKLEKLVIQNDNFKNKDTILQPNLMNLQMLAELLNSKEHQKTIDSNGLVYSDRELEALLDRSDLIAEMKSESSKIKTEDTQEIIVEEEDSYIDVDEKDFSKIKVEEEDV